MLAVLAVAWIAGCENPQAPELCDLVPDQTLLVGESATLNVCLQDPDGDTPSLTATSSDPAVADATASGSTVTVRAIAPGDARVDLVATDPTGLSVRQSFRVQVPNRMPAAVGTVADMELAVGDVATVSLRDRFSDPDGERLDWSAESSDTSVVGVALANDTLTVSARSSGEAGVTATATDPGGLSAAQGFAVVVLNRSPVVADTLPDLEIEVGRADTVDLAGLFADPDGDALEYSATVSNASVARASVSGGALLVAALARGSATVTVTASDPAGLSVSQSSTVEVPNRAPVAGDAPPDLEIEVGGADTVDLAAYFADPDGDELEYSASVSDAGVARASVAGGTLVVSALAKGSAGVTVTASDFAGLSVAQTFGVTVPNRPPAATATITGRSLAVGESGVIALAAFFSDPDGDRLAWSAESSDPDAVALALSNGRLTLTALASGRVSVTVTATDTEGLSAAQSFTVAVANRPPTVAGSLPDRRIEVGRTATLDVAPYFNDPDGDDLEYSATVSAAHVARASVSGSTLEVAALVRGSAVVTVTATDPGDLGVSQSFEVTVPNQPPVVAATIPGRSIPSGESATVALAEYFSDPDGDALAWSAESSDAGVVVVAVSGGALTLAAQAPGTASVTVAATDAEGLSASQSFAVEVPNRAPVATTAMPDRVIEAGGADTVDLAPFFADPDGEVLEYAVTDSGQAASASVSGGVLVVAALARGSAAATVTATDPGGLSASQRFTVTVPNGAPAATESIPNRSLAVGESVSVALAAHFSDPDGDPLAWSAESSDTDVAVVAISNDTLTVTAGARGTANIAVGATDPEGLAAAQTFSVQVAGRAPTATATITDRSLFAGDADTLSLGAHFSDPDGDPLAWSAESSATDVAVVAISNDTLIVTAVATGSANVTVTATDPGALAAAQTFSVQVAGRAPTATATIADRSLFAAAADTLSLGAHFSDPDGDPLAWSAASSDTDVAVVAISNDNLIVTAVAPGSADVTATATDPGGLSAAQSFSVTVPNRAPAATATIADRSLFAGDADKLSLGAHFSDPDGESLAWSAESSDTGAVSVALSNDTLIVTAVATGSADVTVTASDAAGLSAAQSFSVTVPNRAPVVSLALPTQNLPLGRNVPLDVSGHFSDPDGDALVFTAAMSDTLTATVSVSGDTITMRGNAEDSTTLTVTATDPGGLSISSSATVKVARVITPELVDIIRDQRIRVGAKDTLQLGSYFTHPNGSPLTYTATSSDTAAVTVAVRGDTLVISLVASGSSTVTVVASDPQNETAQQSFVVRTDTGFTIDVHFESGVSSGVQTAVNSAAANWMAILDDTEFTDHGFSEHFATRCTAREVSASATLGIVDDLALLVTTVDNQEAYLGFTRVCYVRAYTGIPVLAIVVINEGRVRTHSLSVEEVEALAAHEIGHALGLGGTSLWIDLIENPSNIDTTADTHFTGSRAVAAFDSAGGSSYTGAKVPVQQELHAHWRESVLGDELMTTYLNIGGDNTLSAITIEALADIGYTVDVSLADAFTLSLGDGVPFDPARRGVIDLSHDIDTGPVALVESGIEGVLRVVRIRGGR